jgi:hypothetical protein
MRYLLPLLLLSCSTAKPRPTLKVTISDDVHLDHDQLLICAYVQEGRLLGCMSKEEFLIRSEAEQ